MSDDRSIVHPDEVDAPSARSSFADVVTRVRDTLTPRELEVLEAGKRHADALERYLPEPRELSQLEQFAARVGQGQDADAAAVASGGTGRPGALDAKRASVLLRVMALHESAARLNDAAAELCPDCRWLLRDTLNTVARLRTKLERSLEGGNEHGSEEEGSEEGAGA